MLGVACGCLCHVIADVFYVVPVQLFWPAARQFSYPLLLPPRHLFTNRLYKLAMLADFFSDNMYILPLLRVCAVHRLHEATWRRFAAFWAFQAAVVIAHLHPALMDDRYSHEDFIYWLHCPCGMAFILVLNCSPVLLRDAVCVLAFPRDSLEARAASARAASARAKAAFAAEVAAPAEAQRAQSAVGDAGGCAAAAGESPASSAASALLAVDADVAAVALLVGAAGFAPRRRGMQRGAASAGALRRRRSGASCSDSDDCSSPARRVRSDARLVSGGSQRELS